MATMTKGTGIRNLGRAIRDDMEASIANGIKPSPTYLLRKDGDTDKYVMAAGGKIVRSRVAGHVTLGMVVNPSDLPCIVS